MSLTALVTTFNEADTIGPLVSSLYEVCDKVLVVDDPMSTDNTEEVAAAFGAETIVDLDAHGIGPCLLLGLRHLRGHWVVVIDAGGSHSAAQIPHMAQVDADVVIGSRFIPGARYAGRPQRARLSRTYAKLCSLTTKQKIHDWSSGFRIYSPRAVAAILARPPTAKMHGFQPQALAAALKEGCTVAEYPITYRAGRSSMNNKAALECVLALGRLSCL
jgi:dolichol-phosphate mannosyltransferase